MLVAGCDFASPGGVTIPLTTSTASTAAGNWMIEYHVASNALSFAVITGPFPGNGQGHVRAGGSSADGKVWVHLCKPDGTELPILDTGRIFQISGTNFAELPQRISGTTFRAFLDSNPSDYSLSALLDFAEQHK